MRLTQPSRYILLPFWADAPGACVNPASKRVRTRAMPGIVMSSLLRAALGSERRGEGPGTRGVPRPPLAVEPDGRALAASLNLATAAVLRVEGVQLGEQGSRPRAYPK